MDNTDSTEKIQLDISEPTQSDDVKPSKELTIVFCLPGKSFSSSFLRSWSELLSYCFNNNIKPLISNHESNNVYYVRNMCLGGDFRLGVQQKPFEGKLEYDYIMWIDSDQVFTVDNFIRLLNHNKDVVSGIYMMANGKQFTTVKSLDVEYLMKNGEFEFLNGDTIQKWIMDNVEGEPSKKTDGSGNTIIDLSGCTVPLMKAEYTGLGWTLIKKGVIEQLDYPWFNQIPISVKNDKDEVIALDYTSEDVSFFLKLKDKKIDCYVDLTCRVGHEKNIIL